MEDYTGIQLISKRCECKYCHSEDIIYIGAQPHCNYERIIVIASCKNCLKKS